MRKDLLRRLRILEETYAKIAAEDAKTAEEEAQRKAARENMAAILASFRRHAPDGTQVQRGDPPRTAQDAESAPVILTSTNIAGDEDPFSRG